MDNIIQQLKDNEKPYGLMSEEMQAKAREIGKEKFRVYQYSAGGFKQLTGNFNADFAGDATYCLRPDYEDEPEIVECEIREKSEGELRYNYNGDSDIWIAIARACNDPDFIGFKFEGWIWGMTYKNKRTGGTSTIIRAEQLDGYEVCDMTQAHVLFRQKQE